MAKQYCYRSLLICLFVAVAFYSCDEVFEQDISKELVVLVAPSDSVVSADSVQKFAWEHIKSLADYQLQIVSPRFDSIITLYVDSITAGNLVEVALKGKKAYQWRVRAVNSSYIGKYSNPRTLIIQ